MLLLILPDSAHTQYTPITLGTLHIDMAIKLATEKELKTLNQQWQRSLVANKNDHEGGTDIGRGRSSNNISIR